MYNRRYRRAGGRLGLGSGRAAAAEEESESALAATAAAAATTERCPPFPPFPPLSPTPFISPTMRLPTPDHGRGSRSDRSGSPGPAPSGPLRPRDAPVALNPPSPSPFPHPHPPSHPPERPSPPGTPVPGPTPSPDVSLRLVPDNLLISPPTPNRRGVVEKGVGPMGQWTGGVLSRRKGWRQGPLGGTPTGSSVRGQSYV